ncbi:MAG TPA: transcription elongation factor GreA [bacterium]|nr:transcription elongation factor GreA [bacterium]
MSISYMTREGYDKLRSELEHLTRVRRREIARDLEIARSHGDIKENAEYDAAKEVQAMNERKIAELTEKLTVARVIDDTQIPKDKAYLGARVRVRDIKNGEEEEYLLVSEAEADFLENKLSVESPVGKGLLGHRVGDVLEIEVPAGLLKYEVLSISR